MPVLLRRRLRPREVKKLKLVSDRAGGKAYGFLDGAGQHQASRLAGLEVPHLLWLLTDAQGAGMGLWGAAGQEQLGRQSESKLVTDEASRTKRKALFKEQKDT